MVNDGELGSAWPLIPYLSWVWAVATFPSKVLSAVAPCGVGRSVFATVQCWGSWFGFRLEAITFCSSCSPCHALGSAVVNVVLQIGGMR